MKVIFTPVFNRKKKLNSKGKAPIEIRIYQNRKRKFISTGIFIIPSQWDEKRHEVNKKHSDFTMLNYEINSFINRFEKLQVEHLVKNKPFSINLITEAKNNNQEGSFTEFIKNEITSDQKLASKTKLSHSNMLKKLVEFNNGNDINFTVIDYTFVDNFLNYLRKKKLAHNTVHKHHKNLKKYIDLAIKKGYYEQKNPCKEIKIRYDQKKRDVLTLEEIKKLEELGLNKFDEKIGVVRDMFLFSCYTGLRISDATHLKPEYIKKDKDGYYSLDFITIKVNKRAEIPLHSLFRTSGVKLSKPEIILKKYYDEKNEFVFPQISEPYINRHLKLIASLADISIKVTYHTGRHSFGTYMATKIPLPQLMYLMQHSDIKTTMVYVNTGQELVKQGLLKVDWE